MSRRVGFALLLVFVFAAAVGADEATWTTPEIRLVHVTDGLRSVAPKRDLKRVKETETYKLARKVGLDLEDPPHDLLQHRFADERLFYVFYKTIENAFGDRPYLIQRIKRTERNWPTAEAEEPEEEVTWQVEVFKTQAGAIKRVDQHHGSYSLQGNHRRQIVKEYELGFGEVPGLCEGTDWPFAATRLFEYLQRYQEADKDVYDRVRFFRVFAWTLDVSLAADGTYRVASPELGFDAPTKEPSAKAAEPTPIRSSKEIVVALDGTETLPVLEERHGPRLQSTTFSKGSANHDFANGLTYQLDADGKAVKVFTRPGFLGRFENGLRHGTHRAKVMETMGVPKHQDVDAHWWRYGTYYVWFDGYDRVSRVMLRTE